GLDVGAEERADLRRAARDRLAVDDDVDFAVVVLEVARRRQCAEVHPLPDHAVPDEPVVALVRVALPDARLDLAGDPAPGPARSRPAPGRGGGAAGPRRRPAGGGAGGPRPRPPHGGGRARGGRRAPRTVRPAPPPRSRSGPGARGRRAGAPRRTLRARAT